MDSRVRQVVETVIEIVAGVIALGYLVDLFTQGRVLDRVREIAPEYVNASGVIAAANEITRRDAERRAAAEGAE